MKVGDTVRILKGELLERVGYDEMLNSAKAKFDTYCIEKYQATPDFIIHKMFPFIDMYSSGDITNR
jgi:hypothetical protein